jgi:hypothetical protein
MKITTRTASKGTIVNYNRMFKKKLDIKRIFLPKKDERRGGWRELHCEELDNLHSSRVIFRMVN